jgi:glycine dehydrogenase subunit 2
MAAVTMTPKAGAQGELCGMMAIKQALSDKGESHRKIVLVPDSAHGTNPATAAFLGFEVRTIKSNNMGLIDFDDFKENINENFAGVMITNPNTCGLFESDIVRISDLTHKSGGYLYCDGANFNAVVGKLKPGDLGIDAMHINLHKTFSTPHGGGGPGSGPVVFSKRLEKFCPTPLVRNYKGEYSLIENLNDKELVNSFGRLNVFHGQMGMFVRAMSYMLSHGADGLRQVSEDAVLNANYLRVSLSNHLTPAFEGYCMHEILFSDDFLKETGVETLDFAKAMIDEGYHHMTIYFPLVVHGALLVEPTETESKQSLDHFILTLRDLVDRLKGDSDSFKAAPVFTPIRRLDETQAARKPILRWKEEPLVAV